MDQMAEVESKRVVQSSSITKSSSQHQNTTIDRKASVREQSDEFVLVPTLPHDSLVALRQTRSGILREGMKKKGASTRDYDKTPRPRPKFLDKVKDKFDTREKSGTTEMRKPKEFRATSSLSSDVDSVMKQRAERRAASRGIAKIFKRGGSAGSSEVKREVPNASSRNTMQPPVSLSTMPKITTGRSEDEHDLQRLWSLSGEDSEPAVIGSKLNKKFSADGEDLNRRQRRSKLDTRFAMEQDDDSIIITKLESKPSEISIVKSVRSRDSSDDTRILTNSRQKFPNLHLHLAACAWEKLHQQLEFLTHNPKLAIPTIALTYPEDGATPLHTASWKAPSALALMVIRLLPSTEIGNEGFLQVDKDGNTPLHL